jgi:fructokinase
MNKNIFGGIEAGGTKFVCAIGNQDGQILQQIRISTETPYKTLEQVTAFFKPFVLSKQLESIGLGSFGPIDTNVDSPTYGYITSTPKPYWQNTNIVGILESNLNANIVLDTDVNVAALGESIWGASKNVDSSLYLTIGTGIGGGYIKDGKPLLGLMNPEMGHIRILHDLNNDPFQGICPYHGDCFEGLASGLAINKRVGKTAETIDDSHQVWNLEADYIAQAISNLILILSPKMIILGGGVMNKSFLFKRIRSRVQEILNQYVQHSDILENIDNYIVPPLLGNNAGVLGAIALARS